MYDYNAYRKSNCSDLSGLHAYVLLKLAQTFVTPLSGLRLHSCSYGYSSPNSISQSAVTAAAYAILRAASRGSVIQYLQ